MKRKMGVAALLALMLVMACATASAHKCSFGSWRVKRSPTCTRTGLKFKYCVSCDHWEKKEMPKLPHEVAEWTITKEPTCYEKGGKEGLCSTCNSVVKFYIDELEHVWGEMVTVKAPTCLKLGKGEITCTLCGRVRAVDIDKLGHDWVTTSVNKEPTCHKAGSGTQVCTRCARERKGTIDRLEHVFSAWSVTEAPEGGKAGTRERACTLCGDVRTGTFYPDGALYVDMEPCPEVIRLQEMLRDLGYYEGNIRSGTFGKQTGKAVARFQRDQAMEETGVADVITQARITAEWEKKTGKGTGDAAAQ